jgi:methylglyoxal synthase
MLESTQIKPTIALVAHDGKKSELVSFVTENLQTLSKYNLVATNTTGKIIEEETGLKVHRYLSGPIGGDIQIAARVVTREIIAVFFFTNSLDPHPHDPDIYALIRACNIHNVPIAINSATAEMIIWHVNK